MYHVPELVLYTTQVNSISFALLDWLLKLEIPFAILTSEQSSVHLVRDFAHIPETKMPFLGWIFTCLVYTKTIIYLSVADFCPLR